MLTLGINAYHADAAAVILRDGKLITAVEEERFRRVKHCSGFPIQAIRQCLDSAGVLAREVDHFAISRDPRANLWRKGLFAVRKGPAAALLLDRFKNAKRIGDLRSTIAAQLGLSSEHVNARMHRVEHHPAHLASTFFVSPFEEAAACAIDGFGDFVSTSWAAGRGNRLKMLHRTYFPHSLGLVYLAITQFLGFRNFGDEYKVMGLAPYGEPSFVDEIRRLIHLQPEGEFEIDLSYFRHWSEGVEMTWNDGEPTMGSVYSPKLAELLGPERQPGDALTARHEAIAASLQAAFEEAAAHLLRGVHKRTGMSRLCLAGGCAMNSVFNGKIREQTPFKEIFVQPASADNGTALGAALYVWHHVLGHRREFVMEHSYWGPMFDEAAYQQVLQSSERELVKAGATVARIDDTDALCRWTAERIVEGKVVGWFQGPMEWGARALGNRSIVADPRRPDMRDIINTKIKLRERFRPFAPSILEEALDDFFVGAVADPFMIQVYPVRPDKRAVIPAVTHVDGSGRLQTVNERTNPLYWKLIKSFESLTGVPVLLNTSFNENEPIVHKPAEAMDCFLRTGMDVLVLGKYVIVKGSIPAD